MSATTLNQYDGWTVEQITRVNSHELTAAHVLGAREHILELRRRHQEELEALRATLERSHQIGLRVLRAERAGRKTVKLSDLTSEAV